MKTAAEIIDASRQDCNDLDATGYRVTQARMLSFLQSAVADLRRERPDLFLERLRFDTTLIGLETNLSFLSETYRRQVADKVSARWHLVDDDASMDGKAGAMTALGSRL